MEVVGPTDTISNLSFSSGRMMGPGVEDGCVLHVHRQRAALFHEAAVRHIAAGGQVAVQVNDITDMDVLQVFCGDRSSKDLLSVFNGQHYKVTPE